MFSSKKLALYLLGISLFSLGEGVTATQFSDVADTAWYAPAFTSLESQGIIQGLPDGSGKPDAYLTRAEALKTIIRSREKFATEIVWFSSNLPEIPLFPDTDQFAWYAPYLEVGFLEGIMIGYADGTFRPGNKLTAEEALVILRRGYEHEGAVSFATSDRLKNIPGQWYTDAVSEVISRNLIAPGNTLRIGAPITRAQFFSLLDRLHTIEQSGAYAFEGEETPVARVSPIFGPSLTSEPALDFSNNQKLETKNQQLVMPPLPLKITPQPFAPADPFVLRIGEEEQSATSTSSVYASAKSFAVTIPDLDIFDLTVTHPADPFSEEGLLEPLNRGVGHLFSYPGNDGKVMIYAHSSDWPWKNPEFAQIFRRLNQLSAGAQIYVTYEGKLYVYQVTGNAVVSPKDVASFSDAGQEELVLYTCWPPDSTKERYLVFASPVETIALR
jgi:LPXTG-site transpeptidase (sortase) family protein